MRRRPVVACTITHIGKEANNLDEIEAQVVHDPDEVTVEYLESPWGRLVLPVLRQISTHEIEKATGLDRSTIKRTKSGRTTPHGSTQAKLTRFAADFARKELRNQGFIASRDDLSALCAYIAFISPTP